jgi:hypothetical protein
MVVMFDDGCVHSIISFTPPVAHGFFILSSNSTRSEVKWKNVVWPDSPDVARKKEEAAERARAERIYVYESGIQPTKKRTSYPPPTPSYAPYPPPNAAYYQPLHQQYPGYPPGPSRYQQPLPPHPQSQAQPQGGNPYPYSPSHATPYGSPYSVPHPSYLPPPSYGHPPPGYGYGPPPPTNWGTHPNPNMNRPPPPFSSYPGSLGAPVNGGPASMGYPQQPPYGYPQPHQSVPSPRHQSSHQVSSHRVPSPESHVDASPRSVAPSPHFQPHTFPSSLTRPSPTLSHASSPHTPLAPAPSFDDLLWAADPSLQRAQVAREAFPVGMTVAEAMTRMPSAGGGPPGSSTIMSSEDPLH